MKKEQVLTLLSSVFCAIVVFIIMLVSFNKPQDNLIPFSLVLTTSILILVVWGIAYIYVRFVASRSVLANNIIFYAGLVCYAFFLFIVNVLFRTGKGLYDYSVFLDGADSIANNLDFSVVWYFEKERQQFKPVLFMGILKKLCNAVGIDFYYLGLLLSVILVVSGILAVRYLVSEDKEVRQRYQCVVLGLFALYIPIVYYVPFFYTDMYSFGLGVVAIAIFKHASIDGKAKVLNIIESLLAGLVLGLGITEKITSVIPVIAYVIIYCHKLRRKVLQNVICVALMCVLFVQVSSIMAYRYDIYRASDTKAVPIIHWLAIGLAGDGTLDHTSEYNKKMLELETSEEIKELSKEYIKENISNLYSIKHYHDKIQVIFSTGTANVKQAVADYNNDDRNLFEELFGYNGKHYWRLCVIMFSYMFSLWATILAGAIISIVDILKKKKVDVAISFSELSILGMFLFFMMWEACSRQIFNQMPIIILCAALCIKRVFKGNKSVLTCIQ